MNKKGQVLFYTLMLATLIIVLALYLSPVVKTFTEQTRTDMNCSSPGTLSEYDQATCYGYDILFWFFVLLMIVIAFAVLGAKIITG